MPTVGYGAQKLLVQDSRASEMALLLVKHGAVPAATFTLTGTGNQLRSVHGHHVVSPTPDGLMLEERMPPKNQKTKNQNQKEENRARGAAGGFALVLSCSQSW